MGWWSQRTFGSGFGTLLGFLMVMKAFHYFDQLLEEVREYFTVQTLKLLGHLLLSWFLFCCVYDSLSFMSHTWDLIKRGEWEMWLLLFSI
jgi:hypothetical protein